MTDAFSDCYDDSGKRAMRLTSQLAASIKAENARLKELNREMYEALKVAEDALVHHYNNVKALQVIVPLLAKAEGEGE